MAAPCAVLRTACSLHRTSQISIVEGAKSDAIRLSNAETPGWWLETQCCGVHWKHGGVSLDAHIERSQTPSGPAGSWHWTPDSWQLVVERRVDEPGSQATAASTETSSAAKCIMAGGARTPVIVKAPGPGWRRSPRTEACSVRRSGRARRNDAIAASSVGILESLGSLRCDFRDLSTKREEGIDLRFPGSAAARAVGTRAWRTGWPGLL